MLVWYNRFGTKREEQDMKPAVLVTGAYGGIGKATVDALKDFGFRVFALDRTVGEGKEDVIPIKAAACVAGKPR